MNNILVFGASNSRHSINRQFASYTAAQLENVKIHLIDLNDFEMPIYGIDREKADGIPEKA
ncbi:MAG: NAD(P)H-dependent oxidoreductase, partial [Bacteroidota bacterium]